MNEKNTNRATIRERPFSDFLFSKVALIMTTLVIFRAIYATIYRGLEMGGISGTISRFFVPVAIALSLVSILHFSINHNDHFGLIWIGLSFSMFCVLLEITFGNNPLNRGFVNAMNITLWVFVMAGAYYGGRYSASINKYIFIVLMSSPILLVLYLSRIDIIATMGGTRNLPYYSLFLLPILLMTKSKFISYASISLVAIAILLSYKRAGFFAIITATVAFSYYDARLSTSTKNKFYTVLALMAAVFGIAILYDNFTTTYGLDWTDRLRHMIYSGGTGRTQIYRNVIHALQNQNIIFWITGNGYDATRTKLGVWAHNDFLEILYNFGVFGASFYLVLWGYIIRMLTILKRNNYRFYPAFLVSVILFLWGSLFSQMIIFPYWFLGISLSWGLMFADYKNERDEKARIGFV